jgi:hypothetical protein
LPHVLADRGAYVGVTEAKQEEVTTFREVAVLVEDAVVRQELLPVDPADLTVGAHRARVREVPVEPGRADERDHVRRRAGDLSERLARGAQEPGAKQEILGRVAGDSELGEEDEIRPLGSCLRYGRDDFVAVPVEVSDGQVQLCECQSHGFRLTVTNLSLQRGSGVQG